MLMDETLTYIFDGRPHLLAQPMSAWLASSRPFTAFVTTFRDKIRKKLRISQDQESLLDLRLELETAYLLLRERSLSVVYEPLQARRTRSPDFAVHFTTSLTFMVEVTRMRADAQQAPAEEAHSRATPPGPVPALPRLGERLVDTVCCKLSQLLPQRGNVLLIGVDSLDLSHNDFDLRTAMLHMQQRAEHNAPAFLQRHRFHHRADFFRQFQRLSEILVRGAQWQADEPVAVWVNPQAKHPLPAKVRTILYRSQTG